MKEFYKVLIVDDEMLIRQGIINYIEWEKEGFQIVGEASNGNEALELVEKYQPQIMLTDIVMPGMNGIDLVEKVKQKSPEIEIIVLSSFEDFEYVRQTFQHGVADYILKPKLNTDELIHTLQRVTKTLTKGSNNTHNTPSIEDILKKVLEGYQSFGDIERLNKHFIYNSFVLIELFWRENIPDEVTGRKLIDTVTKQGFQCICYPFFSQENSMFILINLDKAKTDEITHVIEEFILTPSQSNRNSKWIMSTPFTKIHEIKDNYELFYQKLHRYHFYLPSKILLTTEEMLSSDGQVSKFDLNHMIYLFKKEQFQEAMDYLKKHIYLLATQYEKDIFDFKSWIENIIFNIIVLLGNMEYDIHALDEEKYTFFSKINNAFDVHEASVIFEDFLTKVKELTMDAEPKNVSDFQLLLRYIDEHYNEHLSLQILAKHFHFNPSYLSSYFSKHHEEGFNDYLNHVRIEKAKELLRDTEKSISSISEKVGYSEPSYFTKVFKKMTSQSPRNYRKRANRL